MRTHARTHERTHTQTHTQPLLLLLFRQMETYMRNHSNAHAHAHAPAAGIVGCTYVNAVDEEPLAQQEKNSGENQGEHDKHEDPLEHA